MSTSLRGLSQAVGAKFDPTTDPLGIALQDRAHQNRVQYETEHPESMSFGPLPDPHWDAYFQAVHEAAGGRTVSFAGSQGPDLGYDTNNGTVGAGEEVYGPRGLRLYDNNSSSSMQGLRRAGR